MLYTPYMNHINQMSRSRFLLTVWSYQWIQWPQLWQRFNYDNELRSTNWQQLTRLLLTQQSCFHTAMFWCEVSKLLARPTLAHRMTNLLVFLSSDKAGGGTTTQGSQLQKGNNSLMIEHTMILKGTLSLFGWTWCEVNYSIWVWQ